VSTHSEASESEARHGPEDRQPAVQVRSRPAHRAAGARLHPGGGGGRATGAGPLPGRSAEKRALLANLKSLAGQLEGLETVEKATVYRATLMPPPAGYAREKASHVAHYDVVVLIETSSPEVIEEVRATEPYKLLLEAVTDAASDVYVMTARCVRRIGDVDKSRQGLFLFNYFVADDPEVALELWDYLADWYVVETGLRNSTLLAPTSDADYVFVNHARWDESLPSFMVRQMAKPSFYRYVLANMRANRTGAMPLLYRLA
jgi:hypothetical protein